MSHWSQVSTKINNLDSFLTICERNDLTCTKTNEASYNITMNDGSGYATLKQEKTGDWVLSYDRDATYSRFAAKFGTEGGTLMRDYAVYVAETQATTMGMTVLSQEERADGSIRIVLAA